MVIGVIADTKEILSPAQMKALRTAFKGVDAVLHAGPIGDVRVLEQLKTIAPIHAVCGNAESFEIRDELFVRVLWRVKGLKIGLVHGYGKPVHLKAWLLKQFEDDPADIIVYGNNFESTARKVGTTYFFNPGSFLGRLPEGSRGALGPARVGLLFIQGKKVDGQAGIVLNP
jgi:putative phosphoesterase